MNNQLHRRILSALLALAIFMSCCPVTAISAQTQGETEYPINEVAKVVSIFPVLWKDPTNNDPALQVSPLAGTMPALVKIVDVYHYSASLTLYKLDAAEGYTWPAEHEDYRWMESAKLQIIEDPEPTEPTNPTDPTVPSQPAENKVNGTVTDADGNPVLDANGDPLVITVQGELPEGAVVSASVPQVNGEALPNVFDIKVLKPDGTEWQPIDEGKTVTISIPVEGVEDGEYVNVYHFIDYAPDIDGDEAILPIEGLTAEEKVALQPALDAYGDGMNVAVEETGNIRVENGVACFETDSFSLYTPEYEIVTDGAYQIIFTSSSTEDKANGLTFYAPIGQNISFRTEWNEGTNWSITTLVGNANEEIDSIEENKWYEVWDQYTSCQVTFDAEGIQVGDIFQINWVSDRNNKNPRWTRVMIVGEYPTNFNANGGEWTDGSKTKNQTIISYQPVSHVTPPTRTGYVFAGWNTTADGSGIHYNPTDNFPATVAENTVFYAQWEASQYTITYIVPTDVTPSGVFATQDASHGGSVSVPKNMPSLDGYTFMGWDTDGDGTANISVSEIEGGATLTNIQSDMTLVSVWINPIYAILYDANGGTGAPATQYLDTGKGSSITLSTTSPTRPGYQFVGWDANGDENVDYQPGATYSQRSSVTLKAVWKAYNYQVQFSGGTGTVSGSTKETSYFTYEDYVNLTANGFSCSIGGVTQTFQGWALTPGANAVLYTNGQNVKASELIAQATTVDGVDDDGVAYKAITLFAVWASKTYKITYDAQGGNVNILSQTLIDGQSITINNPCSRYGYTFVGWNTAADGTGTYYENGKDMLTPTADMTLYAIWKVNIIGYIGILGSGNSITSIGTITCNGQDYVDTRCVQAVGESDVIYPMTFTPKEGFEIVQIWVKTHEVAVNDPDTYTYEPGDTDINDASFNVVVVVAPKSYTVIWENWDGEVLETDTNVLYGTTHSYDSAEPTKSATGYTSTFGGWSDPVTDEDNRTVTYIAIFTDTPNTYTINATMDNGGISGKENSYTHGVAAKVIFTPNEGYKITGVTVNGQEQSISEDSYVYENRSMTGDVTIVVTTEPREYTVTYVADGKTIHTEQVRYQGDVVNVPAIPGKEGYTQTTPSWNHNGKNITQDTTITAQYTINTYTVTWNVDGNLTEEIYEHGTMPSFKGSTDKAATDQYTFVFTGWTPTIVAVTEAATYTATYDKTVNSYTITFDTNGGSAVNSIAAPGTAKVTLPEAPTKTGYTFTGWMYDGNVYKAGASFTMPAHDVTFTAQWVDVRLDSTHKVYVGINMSFYVQGGNFYYTIPQEPVAVGEDTKCARVYLHNGVWTVQENDYSNSLPGIPADYISADLFNSSAALFEGQYDKYYKVNGKTICIFDETGAVPKQLLSFSEADYKGIIQAWKNAGESYLSTKYGVDLNWDAIDVDNHVVIPYVIKQNNGENWFIDVLIRPKQTYSITYDRNVQAGYPEIADVIKSGYGENYPVKLEEQGHISKTDNSAYVAKFLGWHYDKDEDGEVDADEVFASGYDTFVMPGKNIKLTALWEYPVDYTVEYYLKNPSGNGYLLKETESKIGYVGDVVTIAKTYTGYNLRSTEDWTIDANDHVVKGYYDPITYTVRFHAGEQVTTQLLTYDKLEELRAYSFNQPGFAFVGWSETNGGTKAYNDGASVKNLANTQNAVVDLYALFAPIKLTITQTGMKYASDSGVYAVVNGSGVVVATVIITGDNSVVLTQIPVGTYTIREITGNWTWTYEDTGNNTRPNKQIAVQENAANQVIFNHTSKTVDWLHGEDSK